MRYPLAIRDFVTYQDQPGDSNHIMTYPDPNNPGNTITVDLTLDSAIVTRDLQTEIISLETVIGAQPFMVPGQVTVGGSIRWLSSNLSPGQVDSRGVVEPLPPPSHSHVHAQIAGDGPPSDDHLQYVRVDGSRGFSAPVTAPGARDAHQLITLGQATGAGLNSWQVENIIQNSLHAASAHPITGPDGRRWKMAGGFWSGYTDGNGNAWIPFGDANFSGILSFNWWRNPFPGGSMLGWYAYQYMEDQLELLGLSNTGALIQFIEDIRVDHQALVACTWLALGV
jgi:hypothetical protein